MLFVAASNWVNAFSQLDGIGIGTLSFLFKMNEILLDASIDQVKGY